MFVADADSKMVPLSAAAAEVYTAAFSFVRVSVYEVSVTYFALPAIVYHTLVCSIDLST